MKFSEIVKRRSNSALHLPFVSFREEREDNKKRNKREWIIATHTMLHCKQYFFKKVL